VAGEVVLNTVVGQRSLSGAGKGLVGGGQTGRRLLVADLGVAGLFSGNGARRK